MIRKALPSLAFAATACLLFSVQNADAVTVTIGMSDGGSITTEASGSGVATFSGGLAGSAFTANIINAFGNPPLTGNDLVNSNAIDISTTGAGTLNVYVTVTGITGPIGATLPIQSSFTSQAFSGAITSVTETTFIDTTNGLFTGTALSSAAFTGIGTQVATVLTNTGAGPYSITELYTIVAAGTGNVNSTVDVSIPLVAPLSDTGVGLPGLAFLLGGGLFFWRRRASFSEDAFAIT